MFEDSDFKIYEIIRTYAMIEIHEIMKRFIKHVLKIREFLNNIKVEFYGLNKHIEKKR